MGGWRHVAAKVGVALTTLVFVLVFNFFLFRAVGDPKKDLARDPRLDKEAQEAIIRERGLDRDVFTQFRVYVRQTLSGDLGNSFISRKPVLDEIRTAIPNTLILVGLGTLLSALIGNWLGVVSAARRGSARDSVLTQGALTLYSMPEFWLGMILIYVFAVKLPWLPTGQKVEPGADESGLAYWLDVAKHAILPVGTLTLGLLAQYSLVMRAALADVMREDFVTTARAIGLPPKRVLWGHAVRNALLPVVTVIGLNLGFIVGGVITIEALFSWPGVGVLTFEAIQEKDYPMLQGIFLLVSALVILMNLVVDFLYTSLDPRIRSH